MGAVEQAALKRANMQCGRGVGWREGWLRPFSVGPALPVWRSVSTSSFFSPPEPIPPYSSCLGKTLKIFKDGYGPGANQSGVTAMNTGVGLSALPLIPNPLPQALKSKEEPGGRLGREKSRRRRQKRVRRDSDCNL